MATKKAAPKKAAKKAAPKKAAAAKSAAIPKLTTADHAKIAACLKKTGKATLSVKEVASTKLTKGGSSGVIIID